MENVFDFVVILIALSLLLGGWLHDKSSKRAVAQRRHVASASSATNPYAIRAGHRMNTEITIDEDMQRRFERARQRVDALLQWHRRLHNREAA